MRLAAGTLARASLLACVVAVAACGGDDDDDQPAAGTTTTVTTTTVAANNGEPPPRTEDPSVAAFRERVTEAQELYRRRGESIEVTGEYDDETRELTVAFQNEFDLPDTGELDDATMEKLREVVAEEEAARNTTTTTEPEPEPEETTTTTEPNDVD